MGDRTFKTTQRRDLAFGAALALALLAVNVAPVAARLGFVHGPRKVLETDHFHYLAIARGPEGDPEQAKAPPYCWRILVPYAARDLSRLGLSLNAAFYLLTNVALFGFLLALYAYLGRLGFPRLLRTTGVVWAALMQGAVRWYEYQYWMSDPACLLLVTLAFLAILGEKTAALVAVGVVAAFVRENYAVVFVYYFFRTLRRDGWWRALLRTAAIAVLPALATFALRASIPAAAADDWLTSMADNLGFRWRHRFDNQLYVLTVGSYGVLFPLAVLYPERLLATARRHYDALAVVAMAYASLAMANNTERMLAYTLPVVVPLALSNLRDHARRTGRSLVLLAAITIALQFVTWTLTRFHELGMSLCQPTNWIVIVSCLTFWLACRWENSQLRARTP